MQLIQQRSGVKNQLRRQPIFKRKYTTEQINVCFLETLVSDIIYWPILPKVPLNTFIDIFTSYKDMQSGKIAPVAGAVGQVNLEV